MAIYRQIIKGKNSNTLEVDATDADLADLEALLEGEVQKFDLKSSGGSTAPYPSTLNCKRFSCGDHTTKVSCSFNIPHAKPSAYTPDFEAVVVGAFDASFNSTVACDYMNLLYDRN